MSVEIVLAFLTRLSLVLLFLPFSALDKVLNFDAAVAQARQNIPSETLAKVAIGVGLGIEVCMSLGVLTGVADRFAALVLALYCVATAVLWKRFWKAPDFALRGPSEGRETMWDFLKNVALAGGFVLLAFGPGARDFEAFLDAPFASTQPYAVEAPPAAKPSEAPS